MKKLWFKRKKYGYGWVPASIEGYFVLFVYLVLIISTTYITDAKSNSISDTLFRAAFNFLFFTLGLVFICYKKGEKPKWTWGNKK